MRFRLKSLFLKQILAAMARKVALITGITGQDGAYLADQHAVRRFFESECPRIAAAYRDFLARPEAHPAAADAA